MESTSRIAAFFSAVLRSCYDMEWYRVVRTRAWTKALSYVAWFHALLTVAMTASFAPALFLAQTSFLAHLGTTFPAGAKVEIADGALRTNLPEPFEAGVKGFRVTFDTSVTGPTVPARYAEHDGILVGRDAMFVRESKVERRSYLVREFPDVTMTKDGVLEWVGTWGMLIILGFLLIFAATYFLMSVVGSVLYVALTAALASLMGILWGVRLRYAAWFASGLHAVTLPTVVNLAANALGVRIPFAFTFIYFMILVAVIADERSRPTVEPAKEPSPAPIEPAAAKPDAVPPARVRKTASTRPPAKKPPRRKPPAAKT